jgi:hypothetical protein
MGDNLAYSLFIRQMILTLMLMAGAASNFNAMPELKTVYRHFLERNPTQRNDGRDSSLQS